MHRAMTGETVRSVRVAGRGRLSMDALAEFLYLIGMALSTLRRRQLRGRRDFVVIAVAGLAGAIAERTVNAIRNLGNLIGMASGALNPGDFGGMRIVLDARVAVSTAQNAVHAGGVLGGIDRDAFAVARGHSRLTVASQAAFVLLEWLGRPHLCPGAGVCRRVKGKNAS